MYLKSPFRFPLIANFNYNPFFNKWAKDYLLAIFFFVLGGSIALIFYQKIGYTFFYQNFVPEAILWACGHDFLFPKRPITELIPFLRGQALSFDCAKLPPLDLYDITSDFAAAQPYLTWSVALLWKWFGLNYKALSPLVFALWGMYTAGIYLLFRQFCQKRVAILATIFICLSPVMVHMIGSLRDFSKAPFIIWALFLLINTIKQPTKEGFKAYISPMMAGAIAGLGMGFRPDLYFLLPIGSIFLIIGFCNPQIKTVIGQILSRVKIGIVFAATFIIFASPILKNGGPGGVGGVFIMQGMSEPFRKNLKLEPASYTTGWAYSDELTLSSIAASERQKDPEKWDQKELAGIPGISISQTMHLGTPNLLQWADLFIADFANQAIKSFTWVVGFPLYIANSQYQLANPFNFITPESIFYSGYQKLGYPAILFILFIGFISLLFKSFLTSKSLFFALTFLFLFLGSYPAIQFNLRHFFYLEFIWVLCFISLFIFIGYILENKNLILRFSAYMVGMIGLVTLGYLAAIKYQQVMLTKEVRTLLELPKKPIELWSESSNEGLVFFTTQVPPEYLSLINSTPDSMTPEIEYIGTEWDVRAAASRYLMTIKNPSCNTKGVNIVLRYRKVKSAWQNLDTKITLPINSQTGKIIFTGFYRPTQYFNSIGIPIDLAKCGIKLEMIIGESRLPLSFTGSLNLNQNLEDSFISLGNISGSKK